MTLEEFQDLPTLASAFPLVFASGGRWNALTGKCTRCDHVIEPNNMRGHIVPWGPRHAVKVFVIDALGYCPFCELLTPFRYRMHQDMSITCERDGTWVRWPLPPPSLWTWIRRWLRSFAKE